MLRARLPAMPLGATRALAVFQNPNFRIYLFGLVMAQVGVWMQYTAQGALVYRLTGSPLALGLVGFVPMVLLAPLMLVSGALADRLPRRKLLFTVQFCAVFPPLVLAALTWAGAVQLWHIIAIEVVMQALATLDLPARQALVADTVSRDDLDMAVAVTSSGFNVARIVGPAVAGVLLFYGNEAICFLVNGLGFLVVSLTLLQLRLPAAERTAEARARSLGGTMADGVRYLLREPLLLAAIALSVVPSLFILPYQRFIPALALDTLNLGKPGVGLLNALAGLGAVLGTVAIVWLTNRWQNRRGRLALGVGLALPIAAVGFALAQNVWQSALAVVLVGAGLIVVRSLAFTLVHLNVREELRGRVTGLMVLLAVSAMRVGELGVGVVATRTGTPSALALAAIGGAVGIAALALLVPRLRQAA